MIYLLVIQLELTNLTLKKERLIEYLKRNIETRPMFYSLSDRKVFKISQRRDANSKNGSIAH